MSSFSKSVEGNHLPVSARKLRSCKHNTFYELADCNNRPKSHRQVKSTMAESGGVKPPTFSGKSDEDADSFVKSFERYVKYREITANDKKLNLFAVLLKDAAADWLDALPEDTKSTFAKLTEAFAKRYSSPDTLKYKCASDLFTKKQATDESVDAFVTKMRKLARLIGADDSILKFAVINGLKPYISAQVTQAQPESMDRVLEVARLAELAMSRAETTTSESMVCQQLVEMQAEMRRLSIKVDKTMTTMITPRSPTPERRVHFTRDESPAPRATSSTTYNRQGGRSVSNTVQRQHIYSSPRQNDDRYARQPGRSQSPVQCTRCARNHGKTAFCPARDPTKVCHYCHKPGHFQAACFSAPKQY